MSPAASWQIKQENMVQPQVGVQIVLGFRGFGASWGFMVGVQGERRWRTGRLREEGGERG